MICFALKKLRQNNGYTQQQVADALSIDRSTYAYYESGKTTPDINTIIKLAKIFNVNYIDLLETESESRVSKVSDANFDRYDESRFSRKDREHIYDLTKEEQKVIIAFRLLSQESKNEIIDEIYSKMKPLSE